MSQAVDISTSSDDPRRISIIGAPTLSPLRLLGGVTKLAQYRDLLYTLSVHRIKVRYKQSVLGITWAILQPLSLMLIYTMIFSFIAKMPSDGAPYAIFAYAALLPWTCFSNALTNATNSLVSHSHLVTNVYFPREILPLQYVFAAIFDFLIASTVFIGLMIYYRVSLTLNALYAVPIVLVLMIFTTAVAFLFSATQVRFRDIGVAMPLLLQLWMFATPWSTLERRAETFASPLLAEPMVGMIESFRRVMLYGVAPDLRLLGIAALISGALLVASYIYFKRVEATVADII